MERYEGLRGQVVEGGSVPGVLAGLMQLGMVAWMKQWRAKPGTEFVRGSTFLGAGSEDGLQSRCSLIPLLAGMVAAHLRGR